MTNPDIKQTALKLSETLSSKKMVLSAAESCTGGWIAKSVTDIDGSSQWFDCSIVTYSNQSKINLLGVKSETLDDHGAVSQPVVKEMVLGLLDRSNAGIGVSVSGIAGPGGGTNNKPVGTVWIAWAKPGQLIESIKYQFEGDREQVRIQAVDAAMHGVVRILNQ